MKIMTTVADSGRSSVISDGDRLIRDGLFLATFLLWSFTVSPFPDLGDPRLLEPKITGDLLNQTATVTLTGALAAFALWKRTSLLRSVMTPALLLTMAAFAISALLSQYSGVAVRRIVLAVFTILQASVFLLLPYGREHFARLLAVAAIIVLAACYLGVAFFPGVSIHQLTDAAEPGLAGAWRGPFTHKNGAGATMVLLIFIGIFVYRVCNRHVGILIAVLSGIFLLFTQAKSPLILLPIVLTLSYLIPRLRSTLLAFALVLTVPMVINLLTVGSVAFEPVRNLVGAFIPDPTYTGRDEIWRFALDSLAKRPLFGFGFEAFWGTPDLINAWSYRESWGLRASDAHNGYLNLAVTTGLVGFGLSLWWIIVQPFADHRRARTLGAHPALTALFMQIWIMGICLSGFEAELFRGGSELWLLTMVSIIGIRFLTIAKTRE